MTAGRGCLLLAAALLAGCAGSLPPRVEQAKGYPHEPAAAPTAETQDIFRGIPEKYRDAGRRRGEDRRSPEGVALPESRQRLRAGGCGSP